MRRLNLAEECGVRLGRPELAAGRLERAEPLPYHEIVFGSERIFLDPGTLAVFAAESSRERPPVSDGLEPVFPPLTSASAPSAICLSLTHACNLACGYCYVRAESHPPATMSLRTARRAVGLLRPPGPWRIGFFGGEPTLAWELVCEVTEFARERALRQPQRSRIATEFTESTENERRSKRHGTAEPPPSVTSVPSVASRSAGVSSVAKPRVRFSLTTNGTLMRPERARFLARHGFSLIVSLDGPRELHDAERRTFEGTGSFDRVLEGLSVLAEAGLGTRTTLRATFPVERPELVRRLEFLNALADEGLARAVSVEPAWPVRQRLNRQDATDAKHGERRNLGNGSASHDQFRAVVVPGALGALAVKGRSVAAEYLAAARWAVERIESGKRVLFHHIEKALERILLMRPAGSECGAGAGYIEIAPNGDIHACHKASGGAIGHVDTGISEHMRARWLDNRWYAREGCPGCWARNVCGGGCRAVALEHTGSLMKPWPVACAVKRAQVRAALYVAATCSREKLRRFLDARAGRPRHERQET